MSDERGNGPRERIDGLERQVDRLRSEKASRESVENLRDDTEEIKTTLKAVQAAIEGRISQRAEEYKRSIRERKIDRRWLIGTVLTSAGLVIAAMALLLPALSGGS